MDGPVTPLQNTKEEGEEVSRALMGAENGSFLKRFHGCIPLHYRNELVHIVKLGGPVVISQLMVFMLSFVSMIFCGHLGKTELAGVSLAAAVVNITGISVGTGLSSACDTLISQTYGSGNLKLVGVYLQRGILILLLACFPCWAILINTEAILLAVRQSPEVARLAQLYVMIFLPALPAAFMYQLEGKYLQNQGIIWPQVITGGIGNVINVIINYIFLNPLEWGVVGSAAANTISQYLLALLLFFYIRWKGLHKATWGGWSLDSLQEWGPFVKLAIPSMIMICLSWWIFEIGGFLAGVINEVELGAQSIAYQLCLIVYMFPMGFSIAASVRVGNALGAGNVAQAKLSCKVPIICTFIIACFVGVGISLSRNIIGYIFTKELDIIKRLADVLLLFRFVLVADAVAGAASGALRGAGKQMIGALCNVVGLYVIGFPIGLFLMFPAKMGIIGLWIGLGTGVLLQAIVFITVLCRLNWKKAALEARVRAGVQVAGEKVMVELEHTASKQSQAQSCTTTTTSSDDQEDDADLEAQGSVHSPLQSTSTTECHSLSVKQLVLRRGLMLLIMILILIAGIVTNNLLVKLFR